ncbi:MAG: hypothetical protein JJE04_25945 [Acidobacteriia bacterium]|nr:hypothetical protein [Terriglobia bacterium]
MSFTVFLGNLPAWVTADDIKSWLTAENLVADHIKVIRNPETQESKGFAFIEAPNQDEMQSIIKRFDRAPLEDRLLRANPAQPPKAKGTPRPSGPPAGEFRPPRRRPPVAPSGGHAGPSVTPSATVQSGPASEPAAQRPPRERSRSGNSGPQSAFAEELAKAL